MKKCILRMVWSLMMSSSVRLHQGRFNVRTGEALSAPACVNLKTYPVKVEGRRVMMDLDG